MFADVILPLSVHGTFTYQVPDIFAKGIAKGSRVIVAFGGKKLYTAIVMNLHENKPELYAVKEVISLLDDDAVLPEQQLAFWEQLAYYYCLPLGDLYRFGLPSSLKLESKTYVKINEETSIKLENLDQNEILLIQALEIRQVINLQEMESFLPKKELIQTISSLIDLNYIQIDEKIFEKYKPKEEGFLRINPEKWNENQISESLELLARSKKQKDLFFEVLRLSKDCVHVKKSEIKDLGFSLSVIKALKDKELLQEYSIEIDRLTSYKGELEEKEKLTTEQLQALSEMDLAFENTSVILLNGVTSSGKSHLYMEYIDRGLKENQSTLWLMPEVSLTKQMIARIEKKYGSSMGFYHSKLSDYEKIEVWKKVQKGELRLIIGTRNALFLPFKNLGLIIVDEEHDTAYRQRDFNVNFNVREAALFLSIAYKSRCILGTATPSLESIYSVKNHKIHEVKLPIRFGNKDLAHFEIIDTKKAYESKNMLKSFSKDFLNRIQETLDQNKQIILLHNRRGYNNVIECVKCGHANMCSNCDVVMTYHKSTGEQKCHYCGHKAAVPNHCPKCLSPDLDKKGLGIQQLEEELKSIFTNYVIERMDADSMKAKFAYEKLYEKIQNQEVHIIIGTQMISKGLDFDHVGMVGIVKTDTLWHYPDFRAEERALQLINQLRGRAGRKFNDSKIVLQVQDVHHPLLKHLQEAREKDYYDYLLDQRNLFHYPPFIRLIRIEFKHRREVKLERAALYYMALLKLKLPDLCLFGPEKNTVFRINNLYHYQILIKLPKGKTNYNYHSILEQTQLAFDKISAYKSVKILKMIDF